MQARIIYSQPDNNRLILIFAGWSTTPSFYRDLRAEGWDIAVVWDYTSLDFDPDFIKNYQTVFIVAWSMGVAAAAHAAATSLPPVHISAAFAVNGTLYPSSDEYGIPADIYEATRATLNARNLIKFTKRMGYTPPENLPPLPPDEVYIPDFISLSFELENIRENAERGALPWKRAYISSRDRIFPPEAMKAAWQENDSVPQIIEIDEPHYVHLQKIIDEITPDLKGISRRFERAIPTYDEYASAQIKIVDYLTNIFKKYIPQQEIDSIRSIIEIGAGTGLLSYNLGRLMPELNDATFVDLYQTPFFGIANEEIYVKADAEKWIQSEEKDSCDMIASANTIQWFADPESFFHNSANSLKSNGILLCSTFIPGNLIELDTRRPSPLLYRSKEELHTMLEKDYEILAFEDKPLKIEFKNKRELLLHLKMTGVGGGQRSVLTSTESLFRSKIPLTLTYRPLYILARKKTTYQRQIHSL